MEQSMLQGRQLKKVWYSLQIAELTMKSTRSAVLLAKIQQPSPATVGKTWNHLSFYCDLFDFMYHTFKYMKRVCFVL